MFNRVVYGFILALVLASASVQAYADGVRWLDKVVPAETINGYKLQNDGSCTVTNPADPWMSIGPVNIDASKSKYLYIRLYAESGSSMQVFFSPSDGFSEANSVRCMGIVKNGREIIYRLDLSNISGWKGIIRKLRIDLDGSDMGAVVRLNGVGVSEAPVDAVNGTEVDSYDVPPANRNFNDRMAAWHHTMTVTDEMRPNSCLSTYKIKPKQYTIDEYSFTKIVPGITVDGKEYWSSSARQVSVEDMPGGLHAEYDLRGVRVITEIRPLMVGRDTPEHDGAAVFTIKTVPATPVSIRFGGGDVHGFTKPRAAWLRNDEVGETGDSVAIDGNTTTFTCARQPLTVSVRSQGKTSVEPGSNGGQRAVTVFPGGSGYLLIAFSEKPEQAKQLSKLDEKKAVDDVNRYYDKLLECRIVTPVKSMNQAFSSALWNLEYNWLEPYGWNECIHHWPALWHMQHTGAAEWIGQADRSRDCALVMAENLLTDGSAPQFMPSGLTKKEFGGSNQFYAWQINHYWDFTADLKSIEKIAPSLDRVIAQTFEEYDTDNDGLLAWGQQIGNQEDYVSTPFNGTSPSVEGINMLRTGAKLARALHDNAKAEEYERRASSALALMRRELWQPDLGRFMFFKDPLGYGRLDGQYHSLIYPVIYGVLDPLDSWTSIRHLRDRLIDDTGAVYCSNNFPNHVTCTCGPQTGVAQQPWGAWGLAAVGLRNETYRPLKAAADWVMNPDHRGSWPEVSVESTAAYFSPPAGLYIQSTIEALFGLKVNKPEGYLNISPSFPDSWPTASLNLPDYHVEYRHSGSTFTYEVHSEAPLARRLVWKLAPGRIKRVLVDGKPANYLAVPGVNCIDLHVNTPSASDTKFIIETEPLKYKVEYPASIAEGDTFRLKAAGCEIVRVDDKCGVLSSIETTKSSVSAVIRDGLLEPYKGFGRLGQLNFSRRSFFVLCKAPGDVLYWQPVDISVLPAFEAAQTGKPLISSAGAAIKILVRNNTSAPLKGRAYLDAVRSTFPVELNIAARSEQVCRVIIPANKLALLSPGDNKASLLLSNGNLLDITIDASSIFARNDTLRQYASSRIVPISLPDEALKPDTDWRSFRTFYAYGHQPWASLKPPMEGLDAKNDIKVPDLPGVVFKTVARKMVPVSRTVGTPEFILDLNGASYKKLYLLVVPLLDNHDVFSAVGQVTVQTTRGAIFSRILNCPGDLDSFCPEGIVGPYSTARENRPPRYGLLPMLKASQSDWSEGKPPAFPQPSYWASCIAVKTPSSVMNVIEIDLGQLTELKSVSLAPLGADPGFGLVAVSGETATDKVSLEGTPFMLPSSLREPRTIFKFENAGDLQGWRTEGDAFSVAVFYNLFTVPTLNSLSKAGEASTGKAISPDFRIIDGDKYMRLTMLGGVSTADHGKGTLNLKLIDSESGQVLDRIYATGSHLMRQERMNIERWQGRLVHLEMEDLNEGSSYAWLGLKDVRITSE